MCDVNDVSRYVVLCCLVTLQLLFIRRPRHYSVRCPRLPQRPWISLLLLMLLLPSREVVACYSSHRLLHPLHPAVRWLM